MSNTITFPCQYFVAAFLMATSIFWTSIATDSAFLFNACCSTVIGLSFTVLNFLAWTNMEPMRMKVAKRTTKKRTATAPSRFQAELADYRLKQQNMNLSA